MSKLEKLEKSLREYKEQLEKNLGEMISAGIQGSGSTPQGGMNTAIGAITSGSGGEGVGVNKNDDEEEEKEDKKKDKEMIEEALDEHNEKKHGEAKDADTAMKADYHDLIKFHDNGQWSLNKAWRPPQRPDRPTGTPPNRPPQRPDRPTGTPPHHPEDPKGDGWGKPQRPKPRPITKAEEEDERKKVDDREPAKVHGKKANFVVNRHYGGMGRGGEGSPAGPVKHIDPKTGETIKEVNPFKKSAREDMIETLEKAGNMPGAREASKKYEQRKVSQKEIERNKKAREEKNKDLIAEVKAGKKGIAKDVIDSKHEVDAKDPDYVYHYDYHEENGQTYKKLLEGPNKGKYIKMDKSAREDMIETLEKAGNMPGAREAAKKYEQRKTSKKEVARKQKAHEEKNKDLIAEVKAGKKPKSEPAKENKKYGYKDNKKYGYMHEYENNDTRSESVKELDRLHAKALEEDRRADLGIKD